jgi:hypothetical protein
MGFGGASTPPQEVRPPAERFPASLTDIDGTRFDLEALAQDGIVADEGLVIARSLGLALGAEEMLPGMLQILPDGRIGWRQLGRNGAGEEGPRWRNRRSQDR